MGRGDVGETSVRCTVAMVKESVIPPALHITNLCASNARDKYIGETSGSAYSRSKEHFEAMSRKEDGSVIHRHANEKHCGDLPEFTMNVTGVFRNDGLLRQITESMLISKKRTGTLIDNKTEWNHVSIPRAIVI